MTKDEYPKFKVAFWEWWDNLPPERRKLFCEYVTDMAETFFYNQVWIKTYGKAEETQDS